MSAQRLALVVTTLVASSTLAQVQIDDPPKLLEPGPLTKDELNRRKADQLLRDARTQFAIGIMRARKEKLIEAVATLEKALSLDPDSLEVRRALTPLYIAVGRELDAMALCRQVIDRDPYDADTAYQFARLLRIDARPAEAIAVLQKAVTGKDAQNRPDRLLYMLSDLTDLFEKQGDFAAVAKTQEQMIRTMTEKQEDLLYGEGITREDLRANLGRAYERLGRARVQTKEYDRAAAAFRATRETLLKSDDPEARHQAARIHWNLSEIASAQEHWSDALASLDAYLEHSPPEIEAYQRKAELLRKLGRDRDVVPALRKHAAREEFHLGLQLLLAGEMAKEPRSRGEAEKNYTTLLEKNIKPEIYRGLFHLYRLEGEATKTLNLLDAAAEVIEKPDAAADDRETAMQRERAMYAVLKSDPVLVEALLSDSRRILTEKRQTKTLMVLASLAARTRKLPEAEKFFRQCLVNLPREHEAEVYTRLIGVLMAQKKYPDIVALCNESLQRRPRRNATGIMFHRPLAAALAAMGKYEEALVHADKGVSLANDDGKVDARCHKARILRARGPLSGRHQGVRGDAQGIRPDGAGPVDAANALRCLLTQRRQREVRGATPADPRDRPRSGTGE